MNGRLPNNNRLSWRRNYTHAGKDNNYGADDVIQRPMLSELITNKVSPFNNYKKLFIYLVVAFCEIIEIEEV